MKSFYFYQRGFGEVSWSQPPALGDGKWLETAFEKHRSSGLSSWKRSVAQIFGVQPSLAAIGNVGMNLGVP